MSGADEKRDDQWADRLNEALDARVTGDRSSPSSRNDLDPTSAETVRRFFAHDDAPLPLRAVTDQIWEDLMHQHQFVAASGPPLQPPPIAFPALNGQLPRPAAPSAVAPPKLGRRFAGLARIAIAAVVLLSLGLGYLTFGPIRADPEGPRSIPAAVAPVATPEAPATPVTYLPRAGHPLIGTWQIDNDPRSPGSNLSWVTYASDGSVKIGEEAPRVSYGTWQATGERTAEAIFILQGIQTQDLFEPDHAVQVIELNQRMEVWHVSIAIDETGNALTITGSWEEYLNGARSADPTQTYEGIGTRMVVVPGAATPTT